MAQVVALVGKPGVGKSAACDELEALLGWDSLRIDRMREIGRDWDWLCECLLALQSPCLTESVAMPRRYVRCLSLHDTTIVELICNEDVRIARGGGPAREYTNPRADLVVNTTLATPVGVAHTIAAYVLGTHPLVGDGDARTQS